MLFIRRAAVGLLTTVAVGAWVVSPASAETVPLPSGAAPAASQSDSLNGMSCPSAGNCVSVGTYNYEQTGQEALVETENNGTWTPTAVTAAGLPETNPQPQLYSVSCPSIGNCAAAGYYYFDSSTSHYNALLATETNGTWTASAPDLSHLPNPGTATPSAYLYDLTCVSAGNCTAVGAYEATSSKQEGLIETETDGAWTATEATLSGLSTYSDPGVYLSSVSCASVGNCAAVGYYQTGSNEDQPLIETETNGVWAASTTNLSHLPDVGSTTHYASLNGVDCVSNGNCTAVGNYYDASVDEHGLIDTETNGTWSVAEASLAGLSTYSNASAYFDAVACPSAGNCTAVGSYRDASQHYQGLELTELGGQWGSGTEAQLTAPAATDPEASLYDIACYAAGECVAAGTYERSDASTEVLVERQSSSGWQADGTEQADPSGNVNEDGAVVACAVSDYCAVGGYVFNTTSENYDAFLLDPPDAVPTPSASVTGTQATVSWSAAANGSGLSLTGYTVTATDVTSAARGGQTASASGTSTSAVIAGLTPGDSYTFSVTAASLLGTGLTATSVAVTVPLPALPLPPPTAAQLSASLSPLLAPHGAAAKLKKLRKKHSYVFSYHALEAGVVAVRWYQITGHGKHKHKVLVASGSARASAAGVVKLTVRLTAKGRRLVASGHRLKLTADVSFVGGGITVLRVHAFRLS